MNNDITTWQRSDPPVRYTAPALADGQMSGWATTWYILWNITALGLPYLLKIVIAKAVAEGVIMADRAKTGR